jgi:hypothetical protein
MDTAAMWPIRQGDPDGVSHHTPYPIAEGVWDYFAQDVERAIAVRIQATPVGGLKQPAFDAFASADLLLAYWL